MTKSVIPIQINLMATFDCRRRYFIVVAVVVVVVVGIVVVIVEQLSSLFFRVFCMVFFSFTLQ